MLDEHQGAEVDRGTEDARARRLLEVLRDGDTREQVEARFGLGRIFERRGMLDEAAACYVGNLEAGVRDPELCERLAEIYRRLNGTPTRRAAGLPPVGSLPDDRSAGNVDVDAPRTRRSFSAFDLSLGEWATLFIVAIVCRGFLDLMTSYSILAAGFMMAAIALLTVTFVERRTDAIAEVRREQADTDDAEPPFVALRAVTQTLILVPFAVEAVIFILRRVAGWLGVPV